MAEVSFLDQLSAGFNGTFQTGSKTSTTPKTVVIDGITVPYGATLIKDSSNNHTPVGYALGTNAYKLDGTLIGNYNDVIANLQKPAVQEAINAAAESNKLISVTSMPTITPASNVEGLPSLLAQGKTPDGITKTMAAISAAVDGGQQTPSNTSEAIIKGSMLKVVGDAAKGNTALLVQNQVLNNGFDADRNYDQDTMPDLRLDLTQLEYLLTSTYWPEYSTRPGFNAQFDATGSSVTPLVGKNAVQIGGTITGSPALAYKIIAKIVQLLEGDNTVVVYGSASEFYREYVLDKNSSQIIYLPRHAGDVVSYEIGAATDGTFGTLPVAVASADVTTVTTPAVSDDYTPGENLVIGGSNAQLIVVPYIPTKAEANGLLRMIWGGATPNQIAMAICKLAYQLK